MYIYIMKFVAGSLLLFALLDAGCSQDVGSPANDGGLQVITQDKMHRIDVGNGEVVHQAEGKKHGMSSMSFVITETKPGGGPPLHVHPVEEAHVVLSGKVKYIVGDSVFTVEAPYIVRIPPDMKHTFMNVGDTVLNLVGVFGQDNIGPYQPVADNPLKK